MKNKMPLPLLRAASSDRDALGALNQPGEQTTAGQFQIAKSREIVATHSGKGKNEHGKPLCLS
jgi:hypothetical protein